MQRHSRTPGVPGTRGSPARAAPFSPHLGRGVRALTVAAVACAGPERPTANDQPAVRAADSATPKVAAPGDARVQSALTAAAVSFPLTNPGKWAGVISWPYVAIHMHLMPNGRVLTWPGEDSEAHTPSQVATLWNPLTGGRTSVNVSGTNVFCSGHTLLGDGRLFVAGGHYGRFEGSADLNYFSASTSKWSRGNAMNAGRWYPTAVALANGDVLVAGGTNRSGVQNMVPQVWSASTKTWRSLTGAQAALPYYPWMFVAPNGKVFYAGPSTAQVGYLSTTGAGAWELTSGAFPTSASTEGEGSVREYGSAVMLDGVVLRMGGGGWSNRNGNPGPVGPPITNTAERIDLRLPAPVWTPIAPMAYARRHMNAVILPDGKVFAVGGTSQHGGTLAQGGHWAGDPAGAVLVPEIYDPATNTWTPGAPMARTRLYHSTAMLLPDGRVLVAGGGTPHHPNGVDNLNAQLYSPPYLFDAAGQARRRPVVSDAPATLSYSRAFSFRVSYAGSSSRPVVRLVTLVRLGSPTHAFDASQRLVTVSALQLGGTVLAAAPRDGNRAPPGPYMLFATDADGTPSVAQIVQLR